MIYLDTNVIIDIMDDDSNRQQACREKLEEALAEGPVFICDTVYAETSVGMQSREDLDLTLTLLSVTRVSPNEDMLFSAGKAYKMYKEQNEGTKSNVLPDFFVAAQALIDDAKLISSDTKRMQHYFDRLKLVIP